jgi:hypothetical protein
LILIFRPIAGNPIVSIVEGFERIEELQARAGYLGDYHCWIKEHMPSRL